MFAALSADNPEPFPKTLVAVREPATLSAVRVPRDVMFGWALALTVVAIGTVPMMFDPTTLDKALPFP